MANVLFLHQNFPGQFRHLAPALQRAGHQVQALAMHRRPSGTGVLTHHYSLRSQPVAGQHPLLREAEAKALRGEAAASAILALKRQGFEPDVVVTNPGWGEALYVPDVLPRARMVGLIEFYYGTPDADVGFDPEFAQPGLEVAMRQRLKNLALTECLLNMHAGVSPTLWQASRIPAGLRSKVEVIFDGLDTDALCPDGQASFKVGEGGPRFRPGDPVISFVNRNLEPYRGYHRLMRALPDFQRRCPTAHVVLVGGESVSYGAPAPVGKTWKQIFLDEVQGRLDLSRVHFVGALPYADYLSLLRVSAAHVYLTYPFVLSWSCLEAMSLGCRVIGSKTPPVQEFIEDGRNGHLVDFFDTDALVAAMAQAIDRAGQDDPIRHAARATAVARCDLQRVCLPRWMDLIHSLA